MLNYLISDQHVALISEQKELYTFGSGSHYKLGHGVDKDELLPKKVVSLEDVYIEDISCGISHTLCLTNEGFIYSFGSGLSG